MSIANASSSSSLSTTRFTRNTDVVSYPNDGSAASFSAGAAAAAADKDANVAADEAAYYAAALPFASISLEDAERLQRMRQDMAAYTVAANTATQAMATMNAILVRKADLFFVAPDDSGVTAATEAGDANVKAAIALVDETAAAKKRAEDIIARMSAAEIQMHAVGCPLESPNYNIDRVLADYNAASKELLYVVTRRTASIIEAQKKHDAEKQAFVEGEKMTADAKADAAANADASEYFDEQKRKYTDEIQTFKNNCALKRRRG